ncbi:2353_t:CDS:2 [Acaulospora morrowiae]|uniref:2353_t:CDS:1 n=1 Tax=Acaulospora morrowiae TaxID=94023 RepID=A0A9N9AHP7_9GLOM|nr:2353_t:CDS:2 [Acaulospora morrowiae]
MTVEYGYLCVDTADAGTTAKQKLYIPHTFDKIHLTPSRPKFTIIGKLSEILDWMKHNKNVVVEYDQEFDFSLLRTRRNHSQKIAPLELPMILFNLYNITEDHHHHVSRSIKKFIFGNKRDSASTIMCLEIHSVRDVDGTQQKNRVWHDTFKSGTKFKKILLSWTEASSHNDADFKANDFE